jgi:hypothetical protein
MSSRSIDASYREMRRIDIRVASIEGSHESRPDLSGWGSRFRLTGCDGFLSGRNSQTPAAGMNAAGA